MTRYFAIIENTIREGIAKKTIITLFVLITLILAFFLLALGASEDTLYVFGSEIEEVPDKVIRVIEAGIIGFFYQIALFLGIFAIAAFYPNMQEKGTIDLLLSRPMSRFNIYSAKFIGCLAIVLAMLVYLIVGTWVIIYLKTGIAHVEYLYTIPIFMLMFLAIMSFISMVGIMTRNTTASAIQAIFLFAFSAMFFGFHVSDLLKGNKFWYGLFESLYWIFPKIVELTAWNISLVSGKEMEFSFNLNMAAGTTLAFTLVCYLVGYFIFKRRSY